MYALRKLYSRTHRHSCMRMHMICIWAWPHAHGSWCTLYNIDIQGNREMDSELSFKHNNRFKPQAQCARANPRGLQRSLSRC